ncbi:MAG TPA: sigma-54 dependent transcriptional regulator [Gammaproteobacteria bacterium]|nr:sigma-54 dependent transcriptional regulator [Gammaproteobacteria bacterium]
MSDGLIIIEDERLFGAELKRHYERDGWEVTVASTMARAQQVLFDEQAEPLVVIADMNLPDGNGLDLLEQAKKRRAPGEWIFLTGFGNVPDSVRALRLGAYDFVEKPCEQSRLDLIVSGAERSARAQRRLHEQARASRAQFEPDSFTGRSAAAAEVRGMLSKLAGAPFSALVLTGETGTGKGLAARILHHSGARAEGPLVELNCAALPRELLESELFGHEAGAFTGARQRRRGLLEQAHCGTLFLDEISELELDLQAKVLKAIEDKRIRRLGAEREISVDVQIIAATNRDLEAEARAGRFRNDLYHRLSVFQIKLPALRQRLDDLADLVPAFIAEFNAKAGKHVKVVPEEVWRTLRAHKWPGNVRELRNVIERCVLLSEGEQLPAEWLQLEPVDSQSSQPEIDGDRLHLPLDGSMALDKMERFIIKTALERHGYNVTATARALGTTRETLRYRVQKYNLTPEADTASD